MKRLSHYNSNIIVYGPYLSTSDNRYVVKEIGPGHKKSKLYARYLVEQNLGRELIDDESVDHIDRNKLNDSLDNLRVISLKQNISDDVKRVKLIEIICVRCGAIAFKKARNIKNNAKQGKAGPFCSRSCCGKYGAEIQNGREEKLSTQPTVISEYFYIDKKIK